MTSFNGANIRTLAGSSTAASPSFRVEGGGGGGAAGSAAVSMQDFHQQMDNASSVPSSQPAPYSESNLPPDSSLFVSPPVPAAPGSPQRMTASSPKGLLFGDVDYYVTQEGGSGGNVLPSDRLMDIHGITMATVSQNSPESPKQVDNILRGSQSSSQQVPMMTNQDHLSSIDSSVLQTYFQYYGKLTNQMNMLQDAVRTTIYRDSITSNPSDFGGARVMDVGAGSGILSFFAAQAGASVVYAVEASSMAHSAAALAASNMPLGAKIKVLNKTVEDVSLNNDVDGERVDVLVSEPIGTLLFNERMIESYLFARDNFLKPGGRMFPNRCSLVLCPFTDSVLFTDLVNRGVFWLSTDFHGLNLSAVHERSIDESFRQPVVDYIDPASLVSTAYHREDFDLTEIRRESLLKMDFEFRFPISIPTLVHGIAGWFDALFDGSDQQLGFSTAPWCPPTHWYQIRFMYKQPLAVNPGQFVVGRLSMVANAQQSYYVTVTGAIEGTDIRTQSTVIDLKDPDYRYYTNPQNTYVPPQSGTIPPLST